MNKFLVKVNGVPLDGDANFIGSVSKSGLNITVGGGGGGYTGDLLDSTSTKIATIVDGVITSVVFTSSAYKLLLEDASFLLLEDGSKLILE